MMRRLIAMALAASLTACEFPLTPSPFVRFGVASTPAPTPVAVSAPSPAMATQNSCPHGAPGGFSVTEAGRGQGFFSWNPAPAIHVYELLVERDAANRWVVEDGFPHTFEDVRAVEWGFRNGGSYRAFIRVHTACGDAGEWSPEFKFSISDAAEASGPGRTQPIPNPDPSPTPSPSPTPGPVPPEDGCRNGGSGDHNDDGHPDCGLGRGGR